MSWNPFRRKPAPDELPTIAPVDLRSESLRRFSREEMEVACISAHMSGRVYSAGGEVLRPFDEHTNMLNRAFSDVYASRRRRNLESQTTRRAAKKSPPQSTEPTP